MSEKTANGDHNVPVELWKHPNASSTQLYAFQQHVNKKHNIQTADYEQLWQWSVDHPAAFWEEIWYWTGMKAKKPYDSVGI